MAESRSPSEPTPGIPRLVLYDSDDRNRAFVTLLNAILSQLQRERIADALGSTLMAQLRARDLALRGRLDQPFTLAVLGSFKRGKSSLVNALLGSDLATMNITPETVTINCLRFGPEVRATIHLADGSYTAIDREELVADRLEQLIARLPQPVHHIAIEAPISWLDGVQLIDTPGLGDLDFRFDRQVQGFLPDADAVLFVVSATNLLSATEQSFLRLAIAPQSFPKLLLVVNQIDRIAEEADITRVVDLVRNRAAALLPEAQIFAVSALDERRRLSGGKRPKPARAESFAAAFAQLRAAIEEITVLQQDTVKLDRAIAQALSMLDWLDTSVRHLEIALDQDVAHLEAALQQYEDKGSDLHRHFETRRQMLRAGIDTLADESCAWMDAFISRLDRELIDQIPRFSLSNLQKHFHFFFSDVLSQALNRCVEAHQPVIIEQVASLFGAERASLLEILLPATDIGPRIAHTTFAPATWNNLDTLHWIGSVAQPLLFGTVGKVVMSGTFALVDRTFDDARQLVEYQLQLRRAVPELCSVLHREIAFVYNQIATGLVERIDQSLQEEMLAAMATVQQAKQVYAEGVQHVAVARAGCVEAHAVIETSRADLVALQRRLWPLELDGGVI